jgi:hypothetical protein
LIEHDLFGKPLHTFPDHALAKARYAAGGDRTSSWEIARRKIADVELTASPILPKFIAA